MAKNVASSRGISTIRRLMGEERRLLQEKAALEIMLKNVQSLRAKLKVEQIQLCSHLQAELGDEYSKASTKKTPCPDPLAIEEEEYNVTSDNKAALDLDVNKFQRMFFNSEEDMEEEDDENSEDEIGCAREVLGSFGEHEIGFGDF